MSNKTKALTVLSGGAIRNINTEKFLTGTPSIGFAKTIGQVTRSGSKRSFWKTLAKGSLFSVATSLGLDYLIDTLMSKSESDTDLNISDESTSLRLDTIKYTANLIGRMTSRGMNVSDELLRIEFRQALDFMPRSAWRRGDNNVVSGFDAFNNDIYDDAIASINEFFKGERLKNAAEIASLERYSRNVETQSEFEDVCHWPRTESDMIEFNAYAYELGKYVESNRLDNDQYLDKLMILVKQKTGMNVVDESVIHSMIHVADKDPETRAVKKDDKNWFRDFYNDVVNPRRDDDDSIFPTQKNIQRGESPVPPEGVNKSGIYDSLRIFINRFNTGSSERHKKITPAPSKDKTNKRDEETLPSKNNSTIIRKEEIDYRIPKGTGEQKTSEQRNDKPQRNENRPIEGGNERQIEKEREKASALDEIDEEVEDQEGDNLNDAENEPTPVITDNKPKRQEVPTIVIQDDKKNQPAIIVIADKKDIPVSNKDTKVPTTVVQDDKKDQPAIIVIADKKEAPVSDKDTKPPIGDDKPKKDLNLPDRTKDVVPAYTPEFEKAHKSATRSETYNKDLGSRLMDIAWGPAFDMRSMLTMSYMADFNKGYSALKPGDNWAGMRFFLFENGINLETIMTTDMFTSNPVESAKWRLGSRKGWKIIAPKSMTSADLSKAIRSWASNSKIYFGPDVRAVFDKIKNDWYIIKKAYDMEKVFPSTTKRKATAFMELPYPESEVA